MTIFIFFSDNKEVWKEINRLASAGKWDNLNNMPEVFIRGKDKKDAEKLGRITADVQANITAAEQAKGKKLTADEMRAVVAKSFVKVQVERPFWFNAEKPAVLVDPADRLVIPASERIKIVDALKRNGRPTDEQTIQALYRQHKGL